MKGLTGLNDKLPQIRELQYFTAFAAPIFLFMYYRNFFITITEWWVVITITVVVFVCQIILYPIQMTRMVYRLRFEYLRGWMEEKNSKIWRILANAICPTDVSYDKYLKQLTVEYYYEEIGTYLSIIATFIFFPICRYSWNSDVYPTITELSDSEFGGLMGRFVFLFVAEAVGDIIIRVLIHFFLKVNVSRTGRNLTTLNYRTRFLFGLFVVYLMCSTYYSLVRLDNIIK